MVGLGQEFAGYQVTRRLASGGMTHLYVGVDPQQNRVVIRRLKPEYIKDRRIRTTFLQGAQVLSQLSHPNVVRFINAGMYRDEPFIVVEFVEARNLRDLILRKDPLLYQNVLTIMRQMAAAVSYVHVAGFNHLDIKPENFVVRNDGLVILIDFDLAIPRKNKPTKLSPLPGTFAYLPPETLMKNLVDDQTDIYAFGVTCYEMMTGHKPFEGVTIEDARRAQMDPNGRPMHFRFHNVTLPPVLENMIFKCLAYRQNDRYPSMALVMRDLETMV